MAGNDEPTTMNSTGVSESHRLPSCVLISKLYWVHRCINEFCSPNRWFMWECSLSCPVFSTIFVCRQLCPLDRCLAIGPDLHGVFCSRSLSRLARRLEDVAYRGRRTFAKRRASEGREAAAEKATRVEKACVRVRLAKADLLSLPPSAPPVPK